jgi:hypothetical protein
MRMLNITSRSPSAAAVRAARVSLLTAGVAVVAASAAQTERAADQSGGAGSKPHIVFLFCDNVGWASVGFHRATPTAEVITPNIDELVCTPPDLRRRR